jgi:ABC-type uncharacterized transport system permease subunit
MALVTMQVFTDARCSRRERGDIVRQLWSLPVLIAGALFPITALPAWLAGVARALPTTHVLALLRYGALDHTGAGLHNIWGMTSTTTDAALSLLVLAGWAILITAAAIRVFTRAAVN